ncbi:MAG TPA: Mur ligase family protein, partial [Rhodocyclaceae bacterium]|nr:Mur ligase family protein [Rhodocyclaceae bacterium]
MMTLQQAAQALGGARQGVDAQFDGVSTDSRTLVAGELFVALRGEHFDGHRYVAEVLARGAVGAIVSADFARAHPELPLIAVGDTRLALGALAAYWRGLFDIPVIGVTGSNGKTTVKEMCAAIFRMHFDAEGDSVLATQGNFNNDIGLPLTLLRLRASHRAAVIEMGMNHRGEIDYLSRLTAPTVALVNNAQRAHLAGLGSLHEVALAKGEIFAGLSDDGVAVVNADDAHAPLWRQLAQGRRQLSFGLNPDAAHRADICADICGKFVPHGFGG